ncbi:MAG: hypothetical protein Kow0062_27390 [Acidobacteriota bacterium]
MRRRPIPGSWLAWAAAGLMLLAAGCDELQELAPEEQRLFLSTNRPSVCPDLQDPSLNQVELIATVFGNDGQVQPGVPVTITSDSPPTGPVTFEGETDGNGQFRPSIEVTRPPDEWLFSASIPNGQTSSASLPVALPPIIQVSPAAPQVAVGQEIEVRIVLAGTCDINGMDLEIDFGLDPDDQSGPRVDRLDFVPGSEQEAGLFNVDFDGTNNVTSLTVGPESNERVPARYERLDPDDGITGDGTYFTFKLVGKAEGRVLLTFSRADVWASELIGGRAMTWDLLASDPTRAFGVAIEVVPAS